MEVRDFILSNANIAVTYFSSSAIIQTTNQGFDFNGKSSINLEYGMSLTSPQQVTLLQVGDQVEG